MLSSHTRDSRWQALDAPTDLLVIGGGIVGAGIARAAAQRDLAVALVEQGDFASGTSSRSSKFVHGGLRYLAHGKVHLTHQSVRAREQLLNHGPGLVEPITFVMAHYTGVPPGLGLTGAVLAVYDALGTRRTRRRYGVDEVRRMLPGIAEDELTDCHSYLDAQTDDARLTQRVLSEAEAAGARTLNYVRADRLIRSGDRVVGAEVTELIGGASAELRARVVVNATGPRADQFQASGGGSVRPLRGSHLVFPRERFPLSCAVNVTHPEGGRSVTLAPWQSVTLVGTTDVDHGGDLEQEPRASEAEVDYLIAATRHAFPALDLDPADAIGCYAGVRPVIGTGKADPSRESREHALHYRDGLLTVVGGKLTTYHVMARAALDTIPGDVLPSRRRHRSAPLDLVMEVVGGLPEPERARLLGRYGAAAAGLAAEAEPGDLDPLPGLAVTPGELRWAARHEAVEHLDDLLLRRVRLGLLERRGGEDHFRLVEQICRAELGWDDARWSAEVDRYRRLWRRSYSIDGEPSP